MILEHSVHIEEVILEIMFFRENTPVVLPFVIPLHEYAMFVKKT